MKKLVLVGLLAACIHTAFAQRINPADKKYLQRSEDTLKNYSTAILEGNRSDDRFKADSNFTRVLVRALKTPNSFFYPFDSLYTISKLYAPDSSFRIYTWQMLVNDFVVRQHGAIQMRTSDGSLKLFPLIDRSDITLKMADTIANNKGWMGAVYYKIIQTKSGLQNYYTLLGYDENNVKTNRKIIEILSFNGDEPIFGNRNFSFENDTVFKSSSSRFILEFKKGASAKLNYDPEQNIIVYGHLVSETGEPNKKFTLVPDLDYEGFKWMNGKWVHIENVRNYTSRDNSDMFSNTIRDDAGNINHSKLKNGGMEDDDTPDEVKPPDLEKTKTEKPKPKKKPGKG